MEVTSGGSAALTRTHAPSAAPITVGAVAGRAIGPAWTLGTAVLPGALRGGRTALR